MPPARPRRSQPNAERSAVRSSMAAAHPRTRSSTRNETDRGNRCLHKHGQTRRLARLRTRPPGRCDARRSTQHALSWVWNRCAESANHHAQGTLQNKPSAKAKNVPIRETKREHAVGTRKAPPAHCPVAPRSPSRATGRARRTSWSRRPGRRRPALRRRARAHVLRVRLSPCRRVPRQRQEE